MTTINKLRINELKLLRLVIFLPEYALFLYFLKPKVICKYEGMRVILEHRHESKISSYHASQNAFKLITGTSYRITGNFRIN